MRKDQRFLDNCLDRNHTIQVIISSEGPLPTKDVYNSLQGLPQVGFTFTPRELIHAIGCKTAALPKSQKDECIKSAWLYVFILDLENTFLSFKGGYGSDLQAARSQEIGIGFMCLIAERYFDIPWDQLGPLPGQGKRFDYRGENNNVRCIFEAKGTSYRSSQNSQIKHGLEKKEAHHDRNDFFDVELIISSFIGKNTHSPRIVLADPDKSSFKDLYERGDERYFRLKHYCRVLQYVGLPRSSFYLNKYALKYLEKKKSLYKLIHLEKEERGYLESIYINGDEFLGRWFDSWLPKESIRYKKLFQQDELLNFFKENNKKLLVFQGLRRDIYESGFTREPFSHKLLPKVNMDRYSYYRDAGVSVFPDGTIMLFKYD